MREIVKRSSQDKIRNTVGSIFNVFQVADMAQVPLEDIFTILNRAQIAKETIPGFSQQQIDVSHQLLISSIAQEFKRRLQSFPRDCYESFFSELVNRRIADGSEAARLLSPFSIFTLNWDTIPDYLIRAHGAAVNVGLDYGCYDHAFAETAGHIPSPMRAASGQYALKLLKLHGSLNWLLCSSCGRLFCSNDAVDSPSVLCDEPHTCRFCQLADLQSMIITPTFLKDFRNVHLGMIWHNALLELQDVQRLVFVGCSLPLADFEFRYLLLRGIASRHDLTVRVVLYPPDRLITNERQRFERLGIEQRFRRFFGHRDIKFMMMDAAEFMSNPLLVWHW